MIFISAGHHEKKQGASFDGLTEWQEAVLWRDKIVEIIGDNAISVPSSGLEEKVGFINARSHDITDIAVEIHFNSAVNSYGVNVGSGSETLYCPGSPKGEVLASAAQNALKVIWPPSRGIKEGWYQMNPEKGPNYFLAKTKCPAIIVEPEFVHNWDMIKERRDIGCEYLASALINFTG